jgi:hypothetical protein
MHEHLVFTLADGVEAKMGDTVYIARASFVQTAVITGVSGEFGWCDELGKLAQDPRTVFGKEKAALEHVAKRLREKNKELTKVLIEVITAEGIIQKRITELER